jgi:DNA ligase 1
MKTTLYKVTATGAIQTWIVTEDIKSECLVIDYGQLGGARQVQTEQVEVNQSGRSLAEQINLRVDSRINRQLDKGYRYTIEEAKSCIGLNASDLYKPMLAQTFDKVRNIDFNNAYVQYKYNGHRCLLHNNGDEIVAYSRNGKPINSVNHIIQTCKLNPGETLDGELYVHDMPLQEIGSLVRKTQPDSSKLRYVAYDIISDRPYDKRLDILCDRHMTHNIDIAPTRQISAEFEFGAHTDKAIEQGYEGLILRHGTKGYEIGKRSSSLVKIKKCLDAEFLVLNIVPSKDGWGILVCQVGDKEFRTSAPGTMQEKMMAYMDRHKYIGTYINVEFFEWTKDRIPFHPRATAWRLPE